MLGECVVKIKDITEGLYDTLAGANQFVKRATRKTGPSADTHAFNRAVDRVPEPKRPVEPAGPSDFIKQFKIIDDNPITIQWKNQEFQRKDGTGQWVSFPGGKPVPQQMVSALDKVSPLPTAEKPAPAPTHGGIKAIAVTDNAGVVWTKDEDNNRWLNDAGTVADPAHVEQLEKRALTQYQARQMGK